MRVIVNADDLGISEEVNDAIFTLVSEGQITSATLLSNGPAVQQAVRRLKDFPTCSFGVHLNLTQFKPITRHPALAAILDGQGEFAGNRIREIRITSALRDAIAEEWVAQVERLRALGVPLSHIDSHHHVHTIAMLFPVLKRVQKMVRIRKVRISKNLYGSRQAASALLLIEKGLWNLALRNVYATETTSLFTDLAVFLERAEGIGLENQTVELAVHPGNVQYPGDVCVLQDKWLEKLPFPAELISYQRLGGG
jgi:predicted glycoside hydrolase/deacetylase ChbG (UPF0249 family)